MFSNWIFKWNKLHDFAVVQNEDIHDVIEDREEANDVDEVDDDQVKTGEKQNLFTVNLRLGAENDGRDFNVPGLWMTINCHGSRNKII